MGVIRVGDTSGKNDTTRFVSANAIFRQLRDISPVNHNARIELQLLVRGRLGGDRASRPALNSPHVFLDSSQFRLGYAELQE